VVHSLAVTLDAYAGVTGRLAERIDHSLSTPTSTPALARRLAPGGSRQACDRRPSRAACRIDSPTPPEMYRSVLIIIFLAYLRLSGMSARFSIRSTRKVSQDEGIVLSANDQPFQAWYIEVAV
jgi:hypothetical protein